jgi:uncharacterized protein (TIGR02646 family)
MRPIRKGSSPINRDFSNYRDAFPHLVSRLGNYCSYCERPMLTSLHVEHIQPKSLPSYEHLEGRWDNFLLSCTNCNSHKLTTDVLLEKYLLPDRDNTFAAFVYRDNGRIDVCPVLSPANQVRASDTLRLVGLNVHTRNVRSQNELMVALDRINQRREAWLHAVEARVELAANPGNTCLVSCVVKLALKMGFFSVWMEVFRDDPFIRNRLIDAFPGSRDSGCFDSQTSAPVSPAPNPDQLPNGGKL